MASQISRRLALVAAALSVCLGAVGVSAAQAVITVTTTADPGAAGQCSLRKAIQAANTQAPAGDCAAADALPGATTIVVPAGNYLLNAELHITGAANVVIDGASSSDPSQSTIDAQHTDRVLMIDKDAQATLGALTLTGGRTSDGAAGSCCQLGTNTVNPAGYGGNGGGIYNDGALTLDHVAVKANATGVGGRGGDGGMASTQAGAGAGGQGGYGGDGGGVYNDFYGTLTLTNTSVTGNLTGHGGNGGAGGGGGSNPASPFANAGGAGGNGGSGGGVFSVVGNHVVTLTNTTISANTAGDGGIANGGGNGDTTQGAGNTGGPGGAGGAGGDGGGLAVFGTLNITQSTISANVTGIGGAGGGAGTGNGGGGGHGGAGGQGGGVYAGYTSPSLLLSVTNSTIANNTAAHGGNGGVPSGAGGAGGSGGGIWLQDLATIVYATIAHNQTGDGGLLGGGGAHASAGSGGGLWIQSSQPTAWAANTLFASNTTPAGAQNCASDPPGSVTDKGHNLSFPDSTCPGITGDPALGALQDNGGPTSTMALGSGSAAIDQIPMGTANKCPYGDQRGVSRPYPAGGLCDIGAFEAGAPPPRTLTVTTSGTGSGTVTGQGIDCGGAGHTDCSETVANGTSIALTATPAAGSSFTTFTGGGCGAASPCTVTMDADKSVDAKFNQTPAARTLTVTTSGTGSGTVTGSGIDCGGAGHTDCSETVANGTSIALTATPAAGSSFTTFTGGGCGAASPCTVTMDTDKSVDAKFHQTSPAPPSVTNIIQSHGTWQEGNLLAHLASKPKPPVGTTFTFALNEQARVGFAFTQRVGGRKVNGRCLAQTRKNRHRHACKRTVIRGTLSFTGHSGTNRVSFQGRISRTKKLKPGRYTLIITATNTAGQRSSPKTLRFTIVK